MKGYRYVRHSPKGDAHKVRVQAAQNRLLPYFSRKKEFHADSEGGGKGGVVELKTGDALFAPSKM